MNFWHQMELAGHQVTLIGGSLAGKYTYYCERCGAFIAAISNDQAPVFFHVPPGNRSRIEACSRADDDRQTQVPDGDTLRRKLHELGERDWERLRRI